MNSITSTTTTTTYTTQAASKLILTYILSICEIFGDMDQFFEIIAMLNEWQRLEFFLMIILAHSSRSK